MKRFNTIVSILIFTSVCTGAAGMDAADTLAFIPRKVNVDSLVNVTNSLIRDYRFSEALDIFEEAKVGADSLSAISIEEAMVQAQNGESMTGFCSSPVAIARERFSLDDFFLFYPLQDRSWRDVPNQLDPDSGEGLVKATYIPDGSEELYWSAKDSDGIRNIYHSVLKDTVWTAPELLNEQMTSSSDEIYPMLSPDGKQLFFSSKGLYGMGGYDLYVSTWDEDLGDWGVPVNMGFPFSSPYNDFLYINTPDGKYSMFASDRNCPADSVDLYVLEFDSMPVRKAMEDPQALKELCRLDPVNDPARIDNNAAVAEDVNDNEEMRLYSAKLQEVRALRDSIYAYSRALDSDRNRLASVSGDERAILSANIISKEAWLPRLQDSLARATKALQKIELGFLQSGIVIDPEKLQKEADREVVGADAGYAFSKKSKGGAFHLDMLEAEPSFDYTFQILSEGRFAQDNTLPSGLVYQIQIFSLSTKATVKQIKGLSPVFERPGTNGRHIYSVGLFKSYKDVLANLNKVKRVGFRSAMIVAFRDGNPISVSKARALEKSVHELFQIRIFPADGNALSEIDLTAIKEITPADMARTTEGGVVSYLLGPYDDKASAEVVTSALKAAGVTNVRLESAGMSALPE